MAFLLAVPLVSGALSSAGVATLISSAGAAGGLLSSFGLMSSAAAAPAVLFTVSTAGATATATAVGAAAAVTTGATGSLLASLGLMSSAAAAPTVFFAVSTASATATAATAAVAATAVAATAVAATAVAAAATAGAGFAFQGDGSADKRSNFVPTPSASATRSKDSAAPSTPSTPSATAHTKPSSWENSTERAESGTSRSSTSTGQGDPPRAPENGGTKFSRTVKVVAAGCAVAAVGAVVYAMIPVAAPAGGLAYTPAWAQPVVVAIGDLGVSAYCMVGGGAGGASLGLLTGLVKAIGFCKGGVAAESIAAKMMSSWAVANGGGVASGSPVSVLQSIGAAGFGLGTLGCFIGAGIIGGAAYYYFCGTAVASVSAVSSTWMTFLESYVPWLGPTCVVIIVGGCAYKFYFRDGKQVASDDSLALVCL